MGPKLPRSSITGYMGHVTYIANKLVDASERSLFISQQLDASPAWADFAAGPLQVSALHRCKRKGVSVILKRSHILRVIRSCLALDPQLSST